MNAACCKGCTKRQLHCHSSCPDYAAYKQKLAQAAERKQEYMSEILFYTAVRSGVKKAHRRRQKSLGKTKIY